MQGDKAKEEVKDDPQFLLLGYQADGETLNRTEASHLAFILGSHVFYFPVCILPS